jgi:PhnB protein
MAVKTPPEGYHTITSYITATDATGVVEFAQRAFGARVHHSMKGPDGGVVHADLVIGDSHLMVGRAMAAHPPMPAMLYLYVPDCDAAYARAISAGATDVMKPADQFYGDRNGGVRDAFGNQWWVATHIDDVSNAELERRGKAFAEKMAAQRT